MNGDHLEQLVLSGELFRGPSRSSSPAHSVSSGSSLDESKHDERWGTRTDEEINIQAHLTDSIGMGPGRTGVKGVIRDRNEAAARERSRKAEDVTELAARMEHANLGGKSFLEEQNQEATAVQRQRGRFGHLREVGLNGFVPAVEDDQTAWVVVHIYDPSLDRCDAIDDRLTRLAREHPDTKFIRCRASAIGFVLNPQAKRQTLRAPSSTYLSKSRTVPRFSEPDEDDPFRDNTAEPAVITSSEDDNEDDVDTDMLPTMLVYRSGQLVHNWVRVDWEAGSLGIDELLRRHRIIHPIRMGGSMSVSLDDEDDLVFSALEDGI